MTATTTAPAPAAAPAGRRPRRRARPATGVLLAVPALLLAAVAALAPSTIARYDPTAMDFAAALQGPSWAHWLGTDESGRDLYSRIVHGTLPALSIGLGAAALAIVSALVLGTAAALGGRVLGGVVAWVIEILFSFPTLLLALLLVAVLGPSAAVSAVAIGVGSAPGYARIVRGQVLSARGSGYVEAATVLGHARARILARHVLPNAVRPLVGIFTLAVAQSVVWASGLAFLGLGVAPPSSEWGALLDAGRPYITTAPWLTLVPGLVITLLALAVTTAGRHLQRFVEKEGS